jgi:hypothetical protein
MNLRDLECRQIQRRESVMKVQDIEWSANQFRLLNEGGVWGVPRSGLLWQRRGDELVLINRMPWMEEMPITPEQLKEQQDADVKIIAEHMRAAGVQVRVSA